MTAPQVIFYILAALAVVSALGMVLNVLVAWMVALATPRPPARLAELVERIRVPRGAGEPHEIEA